MSIWIIYIRFKYRDSMEELEDTDDNEFEKSNFPHP